MATVKAPPGGQVVFLCGVSGDARAWTFSGIEGRTHLYPGLGGRKRQPGWTNQQIADEVLAAFEGPLDLIGQSMGTGVCLSILIHHPDRVRSAVLSCGSFHPPTDYSAAEPANRPINTVHGNVSMDTRQRLFDRARREGMGAIAETFVERWCTRGAIESGNPGVAYLRNCLLAMDPEAFADQYSVGGISEHPTAEQIAAIRQPVTVIAGMEDKAGGVAGPAALHRLIPNCRFEILPGGHMLYVEEPEAFAAAVARHFAWMSSGKRNEFIWRPQWGYELVAPTSSA